MDRLPHYRPPAILFPHGVVGTPASGIAPDVSKGNFGPFGGQLFVSDQTHSVVNRRFLEKVDTIKALVSLPQGIRVRKRTLLQASDGSLFPEEQTEDGGQGEAKGSLAIGSSGMEKLL